MNDEATSSTMNHQNVPNERSSEDAADATVANGATDTTASTGTTDAAGTQPSDDAHAVVDSSVAIVDHSAGKGQFASVRSIPMRMAAIVVAVALLFGLCIGWFVRTGDVRRLESQAQTAETELKRYKASSADEQGSLKSENDDLTNSNDELIAKNDKLTSANKELAKENERLKAASSTPTDANGDAMIQVVGFSEELPQEGSHEVHFVVRNNTQVSFNQATVTYVLRDASGKQVGDNHYSVGTGSLTPGGMMDTYEILLGGTNTSGLTVVPVQWAAFDSQQKTSVNGTYGSDIKTYTMQ
ncbi:FxLYD domain-containing protein [Bifidobacterium sp. SO1]|uniref:FxLYD domain-containing protein n=1 Tax=Bifidobacterium sp. SO1 TaxID=2809029 RepID=UPI001BDC00FA|nr:FxLYD domain-containing protein [Bifidobacterium sp. SO1]MBT1160291.1 hypothetical protein [Bifidobacterium sp. SO1]